MKKGVLIFIDLRKASAILFNTDDSVRERSAPKRYCCEVHGQFGIKLKISSRSDDPCSHKQGWWL
ncbi:hypothetical protein LAZ67_X001729 [Cordylochernes scorpioides]|uniref:Uncharacterized protein n=1 Tax=Cordylochernes scorpioides TaxID=51811 RepID=A0ABY6LWY5_9ARAC|nr:hypothetical protein LAZ67_X001729 [Cordylochernes scorpioides]